ncbi:integrase [Lederbergia galactosidilyticus]|uniref:site-specific integrase n=1 Tax=Lederbergia galactosidilytica TaxID=217031 RepID=UPI001AE8D290|nr:site-specific integrase [Lederbergia galactosidilytica]MBP1917223.1 integrase [Lederbergia galactosidilytica]
MKGHIVKRGDKYSFVIDIGRDPVTKKRKQKRVSGFTSERKARKAMIDMIAELNKGTYVEPTVKKLGDYLKDWLKFKEKRVVHSTYLHYEGYINNHVIPALGNVKVADLTTRQVESFYESLLDNEVLSPQSIHHIHRILSNAIGRGARIGELPRNIMKAVEPVKVPKIEMKYWNMKELNQFLSKTMQEYYYISWYLSAFTGMRLGEILGLKWDSVDFDNKVIYVRRALKRDEGKYIISELKNNPSYRSINISDSDVFALKQHLKKQKKLKNKLGSDYQDQDLIVATKTGNFVLPSNIGRAFRRCLKQTNVENIRFHDLRHTHASMLFELKVHPKIVQERLGHSSISVTLDRYSHMIPNMQEAVAEHLESAFKKEQENDEKDTSKTSM